MEGQGLWLLKSNEVGTTTGVPQRCHMVQVRMADAPKGEAPASEDVGHGLVGWLNLRPGPLVKG